MSRLAPRAIVTHPSRRRAASFLAGLALAFAGCVASATSTPARRVEGFHRGWKFARGSHPGAEAEGFDDSAWETVRIPHDWAIAGPYEPRGDANTGKLPWRGEGWYRKTFELGAADAGSRIYLDFDGVMAMPAVYVNGQLAGGWDYGYMSFRVDATGRVRFGSPNLVAVHVDTRQHSSRWYPGAGIYRKAEILIQEPIHVAHWGTFVTTPDVTDSKATVRVRTTVENHTADVALVEVETTLLDPDGIAAGNTRAAVAILANGAHELDGSVSISKPLRWDVRSPRLYRASTRVRVGGAMVDSVETPFGIRTFAFTANDGFHLNGRRVQLHGVNLHHDHGPLGAAFLERAMERQLEILKEMGVNAIRTSHNPPAPELLDLCDRMGFVVWDELFDKWDGNATMPHGASILEYGKKQVESFVRRDRNHPCVVVWSAGNEIWDLETGKLDDPPGLLRRVVGFFKALDTTRPVALAHAVPQSASTPLDDCLDVAGWNYARRYALERERRPNLPIVYSESASALSTRGFYELPHPTRKDDYSTALRIDSYDHNSASYSDIADTELARMERDGFVAGEFVWTGFDYLGEPAPLVAEGWGRFTKRQIAREDESRISSFGIVDLAGIPKDRYYLYRSHWAPEKTTIHILPHWNWPDRVGQIVPVYVYTNGDSAELFINGKSLGKKSKQPRSDTVMDRYRLRWEDAVHQPGEIRAVAYLDGREIGQAVVRTAGEPAALRLTPDRVSLRGDGDDLSYVLIEALDREGVPCPLAMNDVAIHVDGPAAIAGVANGDSRFPAEMDAERVALFYGQAVVVVRATEGNGGGIRVTAESDGLRAAAASLQGASSAR